MDIRKIDYTKKENQDFKHWFQFCMANLWLPITLVGLIFTIIELVYLKTVMGWVRDSFNESIATGIFVTPFLFIPLAIFLITAYKGCYQHWNDTIHGTSR